MCNISVKRCLSCLCCHQVEELQTPLRDGWGICTDGASLIVSDSSATLAWLDPDTLQQQRTVDVHDGDATVPWVNEVSTGRPFCDTSTLLALAECLGVACGK